MEARTTEQRQEDQDSEASLECIGNPGSAWDTQRDRLTQNKPCLQQHQPHSKGSDADDRSLQSHRVQAGSAVLELGKRLPGYPKHFHPVGFL